MADFPEYTVNYLGRRYVVKFTRAVDVRRENAGGHMSRVDMFDVTGRAVINLARTKAAKDAG